jgi:hypothetical protein
MTRLPKEEICRRGEEVFAFCVAPTLDRHGPSRFVAIDVLSEDFEIDLDKRAALTRLRKRHPDAQTWLRKTDTIVVSRIGFRAAS